MALVLNNIGQGLSMNYFWHVFKIQPSIKAELTMANNRFFSSSSNQRTPFITARLGWGSP